MGCKKEEGYTRDVIAPAILAWRWFLVETEFVGESFMKVRVRAEIQDHGCLVAFGFLYDRYIRSIYLALRSRLVSVYLVLLKRTSDIRRAKLINST
jgi:hypothetical protein